MFKRLRNNMLLFNVITVSLVIVTAFSVIYFATYSSIERENERWFEAMSAMPFTMNRPFPGGAGETALIPERFGADYRVSFVLLIKNGDLENISSHLDFEDRVYDEALEKIGGKTSGKITLGDRKWAFMVSDVPLYGTDRYERVVFLDITNDAETLRELLITLSSVGLAVLLALLWFSYHFAVRAVRPIEESYNKQKQFVADASHEFKTPLAIIGANLDAIEASANESVESQKEWFGYIRAELKRSRKLVDDLLYMARVEKVNFDGNTPFDLSLACETACASMEAVLYDGGISLDTNITENIMIAADGEKITQVIYILLDNAGKYTPRGGRIVLSLGFEHERAVVRVSNTGRGIAAGDLPEPSPRRARGRLRAKTRDSSTPRALILKAWVQVQWDSAAHAAGNFKIGTGTARQAPNPWQMSETGPRQYETGFFAAIRDRYNTNLQ